MRVRIGETLYWVGVFVAVVIAVGMVGASLRSLDPKMGDIVASLVVAAGVFGAGYGARYVLAGK